MQVRPKGPLVANAFTMHLSVIFLVVVRRRHGGALDGLDGHPLARFCQVDTHIQTLT